MSNPELDTFAKLVMASANAAKKYNVTGRNDYCNSLLTALKQDAYTILSMAAKEELGAMTPQQVDAALDSIIHPKLEEPFNET